VGARPPQGGFSVFGGIAAAPKPYVYVDGFNLSYIALPGGPRSAWVTKTEEKGSDVNLAAHLLADTFTNALDIAGLIANDLLEPIKQGRAPGAVVFEDCPVGVVLADRRGNLEPARKFEEELP
jgi:hypothetical protein